MSSHSTESAETWTDLPRYSWDYEVSDLGRVRSCTRYIIKGERKHKYRCEGRMLKLNKMKTGYVYVDLGKGNKELVHRLVLEAFVGPCPAGMECRHLDGDKSNNRLDNLCWGTKSENYHDKVKHGTVNVAKGTQYNRSGLTEDDVREIRRRREAGERPRDLAKEFKITQASVCDIAARRTWKHVV